jgi:hypothetical protein
MPESDSLRASVRTIKYYCKDKIFTHFENATLPSHPKYTPPVRDQQDSKFRRMVIYPLNNNADRRRAVLRFVSGL